MTAAAACGHAALRSGTVEFRRAGPMCPAAKYPVRYRQTVVGADDSVRPAEQRSSFCRSTVSAAAAQEQRRFDHDAITEILRERVVHGHNIQKWYSAQGSEETIGFFRLFWLLFQSVR